MKMKNVLMILVTLAMVFAMAGAVSGDDNTLGVTYENGDRIDNNEGEMTVNYTVLDSYTVTIPADVDFTEVGAVNGELVSNKYVNATNVLINYDKKLVVNLTSKHYMGGNYYLNNSGSWIRYYINVTSYSGDADTVTPEAEKSVDANHFLEVLSGAKYPGNSASGSAGVGGFVKLTFKTTSDFISNATKSGDHRDTLTFKLDVIDKPAQPNNP